MTSLIFAAIALLSLIFLAGFLFLVFLMIFYTFCNCLVLVLRLPRVNFHSCVPFCFPHLSVFRLRRLMCRLTWLDSFWWAFGVFLSKNYVYAEDLRQCLQIVSITVLAFHL